MVIVVVGGTGHIGRKVVALLQRLGHAVIVASPTNGFDAITKEGVTAAVAHADIVVDVSNSPSLTGAAAHDFFTVATTNLMGAERSAGVKHHVLLSIVGADTVDDGYFAAKNAQEKIVRTGGVPFTILRATQFFEFAYLIADWNTRDDTVRLPPTELEPVGSDDVAAAVVHISQLAPSGGVHEIGGPQRMPLDDFVRRVLVKDHDIRYVVRDAGAAPIGFNIESELLVPASTSLVGTSNLHGWLDTQLLTPSGTAISRVGRRRSPAYQR